MKLSKYLVNLWLAMTNQRPKLDPISLRFWESCDFTYLGGETYYANREGILTKILSEIGPFDSAVDVGCGDGRFTLLVAQFARYVNGYDISPALIRAARERASREGNGNARFDVAELGQLPMSDEADLVVCFGVVSCIHEDQKCTQLVDTLKGLVKPGGYVLLIDTLGMAQEITKAYRNGYVAQYREQVAY
jgi:ubiquinone/menaquinone biosynthesis C-methylase UbiE